MRPILLYSLILLMQLTACGDAPSEVGPGGVGVDDAKALDDAAAKLDLEAAVSAASNDAAEN